MKTKKGLIYFLISISVGYLFYNYLFTDYGYSYGMMSHHYGYYDNYSGFSYYLNAILVFISYSIIIIGTILLVKKKTESRNDSLTILDERLSKGEISIEEYQKVRGVINSK